MGRNEKGRSDKSDTNRTMISPDLGSARFRARSGKTESHGGSARKVNVRNVQWGKRYQILRLLAARRRCAVRCAWCARSGKTEGQGGSAPKVNVRNVQCGRTLWILKLLAAR